MVTLIANPPVGIYKGPLNLGQACYHVWNDFTQRSLALQGISVICPRRSVNVYGRRAEKLAGSGSLEARAQEAAANYLGDPTLDQLHLQSSGIHSDAQPEVGKKVLALLDTIARNGYLISEGDDLFLDVPKIASENDLARVVADINFHPFEQRREMVSLLQTATQQPIKISSDTQYTLRIQHSSLKLSPIFVAANSWEAYSVDSCVMPMSYNVLAKYGFLRVLSSVAGGHHTVQEVYVFPRVVGEWSENIRSMLTTDSSTDAFRYACAKSHSVRSKECAFDITRLRGGLKLVHLIGNLHKRLPKQNASTDVALDILSLVKNRQYATAIGQLEAEMRDISKKIQEKASNHDLAVRFHGLLPTVHIFMPSVARHTL